MNILFKKAYDKNIILLILKINIYQYIDLNPKQYYMAITI